MRRLVKKSGKTLEYSYIASRGRSRVTLKVRPEGKIVLYVPAGFPLRSADKIVADNLDAIEESILNFRRTESELPGTILVEGRRLGLQVESAGANRITLETGRMLVKTVYEDPVQIREQIRRFLSGFALKRICDSLEKWRGTIPKSYGRVTIREQKTRWGSCSAGSNLNFNWKLVMAPPEALEYVVVHELCHLLVFNHSPQFWKEVGARLPDYAVWKKWLKVNGSLLKIN